VHKLSKKPGYGIYSAASPNKEVFIAEYVGEKIPSQCSTIDSSYVYLTDDNTYVDAESYGNVTRFINHCPHNHTNEDVMTAKLAVVLPELSKNVKMIFFITIRDIKAFQPLCYDYGNKYTHNDNIELLNTRTYLPMHEHDEL
jgi:SET domain-containing protein